MGYLVCDACGGYYKLQEGEKPEDFSDECECGGILHYTESLKSHADEHEEQLNTIKCPYCGSENPEDAATCQRCNETMVRDGGNDRLGQLYKDEQLLSKKGKTIQEYGVGLKAKSKRKELKIASDVQEILDIRGSYLVTGKDDRSIKILNKGLETDHGGFIGFEDVTNAGMDEEIPQETSGLDRLIVMAASLFDTGKRTLQITHSQGEIVLENVKKSDAEKLVCFLNMKIGIL